MAGRGLVDYPEAVPSFRQAFARQPTGPQGFLGTFSHSQQRTTPGERQRFSRPRARWTVVALLRGGREAWTS
jgi:hypothetical protein